jgi:hypothetical protein
MKLDSQPPPRCCLRVGQLRHPMHFSTKGQVLRFEWKWEETIFEAKADALSVFA